MKKIKSIFLIVLSVVLMQISTPIVMATGRTVTQTSGQTYMTVVGSPSSDLAASSAYSARVVSDSGALYLQLYLSSTAINGKRAGLSGSAPVTISGLTFTPAGSSWNSGNECKFTIANDDDNVTYSTNNIKIVSQSRTNITKGNNVTVVVEVVDYNVDSGNVAADTKPSLGGYNSNGSFALTNTNVTGYTADPVSGKYTFRMELPLRYTGTGNSLSFTASYVTLDNVTRTLDCTVTIPYTVEYVEDKDDDDDTVLDPLTPYIIVDSYSYGGSEVLAGESFTLKLRLRNTSTTNSLENIVMSISPQGVFSMGSASNTYYIPTLQAGSIIEREITINTGLTKVTDDDDANSINFKFSYQYANMDKIVLLSGNSDETINIPVTFPDRFEVGTVDIPQYSYAGEETSISVPLVNKGRSSIYNISVSITGDIVNSGQSQYVGNLNAGSESTTDFYVTFNEGGSQSGEIKITYEDANMNNKEVIIPYFLEVEGAYIPEPFPEDPSTLEPPEPEIPVDVQPDNTPRNIKILLAIVVASMTAYVTIQKARLKRSIYLDESI